jgi:hypothetical protein
MTWGIYIRTVLLYLGAVALSDLAETVRPPGGVVAPVAIAYVVGSGVYLFRYLFQHRGEIEARGRAAARFNGASRWRRFMN